MAASFAAVQGAAPRLRQVLVPIVLLHALRCLQADLAWLLTEELLSFALAKALPGAGP